MTLTLMNPVETPKTEILPLDNQDEIVVEYTKSGKVRKRKPKTSNTYFTEDTQNAIVEYVKSTDQEFRNTVYRERVEYGFFKLTQNIIHTFKFYYTDGESVEDVQQEVIAFLLEKLRLYNPEKGKAYSYFGTIAKRYLILKNKKNYQKLQDKGGLEEVDDDKKVKEEVILSHYGQDNNLSEFMTLFIKHVDKNLNKLFPKDIDAKTADAILELFRKREALEIFNKKALYIYIREMIDVDTPQITKITKKLKIIYVELFNAYYEDGYVNV
jgi:hypothetical protein